MKREELIQKIENQKKGLLDLGVYELIISRECSLEGEIDYTIPIIVRLDNEDYDSYNKVQEFMSNHIYEHIEVIPHDSFEVAIDDHFDNEAIKIKFSEE
ncbi:MAG: hypothetical protein ACP5QK_07320 [Myxococcota bacterium]